MERGRATRVPPHLLHLFWNIAPGQLDVASSASFIARRLITSFDPDGLAWGSHNLPASAWQHAAATSRPRAREAGARAQSRQERARCRLRPVREILPPGTAATCDVIAQVVPPAA